MSTGIGFGVFVPQGWRMDLVEIRDPIEQYEAMTNVAKTADSIPGWDSIWVYDHFHTVPSPPSTPPLSAGPSLLPWPGTPSEST